MSPALVLKDPDLIKDILVKDFDHFVDHKRVIPEGSDPIWDKNLFFLIGKNILRRVVNVNVTRIMFLGQKWRDMRSALTPVFTGSKMRYMFNLIANSVEQFIQHFEKQEEKLIKVEIKDMFARLTSDIIASTVFGFETDSVKNRESKFYEMARKITDFSGIWQGLKLLGFFIFPKLYKVCIIQICTHFLKIESFQFFSDFEN